MLKPALMLYPSISVPNKIIVDYVEGAVLMSVQFIKSRVLRFKYALFTLLLITVLVIAGCSGDGDDGPELVVDPPPVTEGWTQVNPYPTGAHLESVVFENGLYVAVGESGTVLTSEDGLNWSSYSSGAKGDLNSVVWGDGQFVAVGDSGAIAESPDGINWTHQNQGGEAWLESVAWNGSLYAAVGWRDKFESEGVVLTSSDGETWSEMAMTEGCYSIVWGDGQFVAVGSHGAVLTSPDGLDWTEQDSGTSGSIYSVAWNGSLYVAVGIDGLVRVSADGYVWYGQASNASSSLQSVSALRMLVS